MGANDTRRAARIVQACRAAHSVIHLDTSFLISALLAGSPQDQRLRTWLVDRTSLGVSAVAWAEFLCGPITPEQLELANRIIGEPHAFGGDEARLASRLFNLGGRRRGSLIDCMIAATAIRTGAALATANPTDFRRFETLGLELARPTS
jgi:predicted nucleic acid-binding protein